MIFKFTISHVNSTGNHVNYCHNCKTEPFHLIYSTLKAMIRPAPFIPLSNPSPWINRSIWILSRVMWAIIFSPPCVTLTQPSVRLTLTIHRAIIWAILFFAAIANPSRFTCTLEGLLVTGTATRALQWATCGLIFLAERLHVWALEVPHISWNLNGRFIISGISFFIALHTLTTYGDSQLI